MRSWMYQAAAQGLAASGRSCSSMLGLGVGAPARRAAAWLCLHAWRSLWASWRVAGVDLGLGLGGQVVVVAGLRVESRPGCRRPACTAGVDLGLGVGHLLRVDDRSACLALVYLRPGRRRARSSARAASRCCLDAEDLVLQRPRRALLVGAGVACEPFGRRRARRYTAVYDVALTPRRASHRTCSPTSWSCATHVAPSGDTTLVGSTTAPTMV